MKRFARGNAIITTLLASGMALEHAHRYRKQLVRREIRVRDRDRLRYPVHFHTLRLLLLFGLAGILVDMDHLFEGMARTTHLPVAIVCGIVLCCALALDYRRIHHASVNDDSLDSV